MKSFYRDPQVEEGIHNIILQNRCGNRLTLLFHAARTELEFVYKPNACRRREFRARNFSNRDNFTTLFRESEMPEITAGMIQRFGYDPFVTRLETRAESLARNYITAVNIADENCFALAARCPLVLTFRPHRAFNVRDGLITESFEDRGEQIVSFIKFSGMEPSRFRVLDDGRYVLQLIENDVVLIGGEENSYQVERALSWLAGLSLDELIERNERLLAPELNKGHIHFTDPDFQRVIDINRRATWSGLDEGGACFGALNRIYHLIWVRDGSMSNSYLALAGNPRYSELWTPFLLRNPAVRRADDGRSVREFVQLLGSRWTKSEDDGVYYAALSLYTLYQTTGNDALIAGDELRSLLEIADHTIATRFDRKRKLFGSDTRGESTLAHSIYFGYDTVNGEMDKVRLGSVEGQRQISRAYSLYHNINAFNALRMIEALLAAHPQLQAAAGGKYAQLAAELQDSLNRQFVKDDGVFRSDLLIFADGSEEWVDFAKGDYWEYAWAVSTGPFFPNLAAAIASARLVAETWPSVRDYGYCPWNTLSRMLKEYGLSTAAYREMLSAQLREALLQTPKYPMVGAVTEYYKWTDGWRALPFGTGSLILSATSLLLQPLPMGLAVRASNLVDKIEQFHRRTARIEAVASGQGDVVESVRVNGQPLAGTLQLPEAALRFGPNRVEVTRGQTFSGFRLYSSTAALLSVEASVERIRYHFNSPLEAQLVFENYSRAKAVHVTDGAEKSLKCPSDKLLDTGLTLLRVPASGDFRVVVELA